MIKIDSNRLRNETKPKITNAISNLNQASGLLKGLKIPSNFCYLSDLKGMSSQIEQIVTDVKGINTYIDQKIAEFDAARQAVLSSNLNWSASYQGGKIGNGYGGYGILITNPEEALNQTTTELKRTGASVANLFASVIKGVADFGEALIDTGAVIVSAPLTIITAGQDIVQSLKSGKGLKDIDFKNTKDLWTGTMSMVSEDTVGNAFNKFYSDTKIGKWLDTNAYTPFKSTGAVTKVAEGIGQIAGVVALTVLTGGAATPAMAAKVSAGIAGARGFGEGAEYLWSKQRDSSWEEIQRKYQKGEISQETMETYKYIRSMSEKEIYRLYRASKITQEQYKAMLEIKQMPEDWITGENALKGLGYALATGGWEAAQYYVGNLVNNLSIKGFSEFANAATRVGIDTLFNAADTPFRAGVESLLTKRNFKEIFDEQGGINSVLVTTGVGAIGSIGGELFNYYSDKEIGKIQKEYEKTFSFDYQRDRSIRANIQNRGTYSDTDYCFQYTQMITNSYGVDQGAFNTMYWFEVENTGEIIHAHSPRYMECLKERIQLKKVAVPEYFDFKNLLYHKYGMDDITASTVMSAIDSQGACSYASVANDIVAHFKNSPQEFENIFGFPLYKEVAGVHVINDKELLADLFIFANSNKSNGIRNLKNLLYKNEFGQICVNDINGRPNIIRDLNGYSSFAENIDQEYMMYSNGINHKLLNEYLMSKDSSLYATTGNINKENVTLFGKGKKISDKKMENIINYARQVQNTGAELSLGLRQTDIGINFHDIDNGKWYCSTLNWSEGVGHATKITAIVDNGLIVSTWGKRIFITFDDLKNSGSFSIKWTQFSK